jgi:DNA excision repair protein ERCC-4
MNKWGKSGAKVGQLPQIEGGGAEGQPPIYRRCPIAPPPLSIGRERQDSALTDIDRLSEPLPHMHSPEASPGPSIVIDTREQTPLVFSHLPSTRGTLQSGDYSIAGLEHDFAIERKSVPDLLGSVTRERDRFERELHRLRGFSFARVLIVGEPYEVQRAAKNPKAVFSSLSAFEARYRVPVIWEPSPAAAALLVERWSFFFWRERVALKSPPVCQLPSAAVAGRATQISAIRPAE